MRQRWRQVPSSSLCILVPQVFGEQSPQVSSFPRLPVLVTGVYTECSPVAFPNHSVPMPRCCPDSPSLPHSPRGAIARVSLKPSTNKRGVSPAAAHSPGKATAAEALTWKFTQTLSGFAIKQQNVTLLLLLLPLHFTSLQPAWQGHCPPVLCRDRDSTEQTVPTNRHRARFTHRAAPGHSVQNRGHNTSFPCIWQHDFLTGQFSGLNTNKVSYLQHKGRTSPCQPEGCACFPGMSAGTTIGRRTSLTDLLKQTASRKEGQEQGCCLSNL